jgi:hypothetical protein
MKTNHEETKSTKKGQKKTLRYLRFFVVDFPRERIQPRSNEEREERTEKKPSLSSLLRG